MIVAPCSVRSMSEIATGVTTSLLTRAADVTLKERRPLILMVRETPLHLGHLRSLVALSEMGAIILPPVPAFYAEPKTPVRPGGPDGGQGAGSSGLSMADDETLGRRACPTAQRKARQEDMSSEVTKPDEVALRARLATLVQEHRDLDAAIDALAQTGAINWRCRG